MLSNTFSPKAKQLLYNFFRKKRKTHFVVVEHDQLGSVVPHVI